MVDARVSRQSGEVLAQTDEPVAITRLDVEVGGLAGAANAVDQALVSRLSAEVLFSAVSRAAASRLDVEVGGLAAAANAVDQALISRMSGEVFASISPRAVVTRLDVEVGGLAGAANAVDQALVSRISGENFARRGSSGPVFPLALADDAELFLHDWADQVVLRSAYLTDVVIAATGAESRLGLRLKPSRSMDVVWRQTRDEFDADDLSRLDRLYVFLRRLTASRIQIPLYPDLRILMQAYGSGDDTLLIDTTRGRWFTGARVAVIQLTYTGSYSSHSYHLIQAVQSGHIELTAPLGVEVRTHSMLIPVIDCEVALEVDMLHEVGCLAEVSLTVDEVPGASQLPPTKADTPVDTPTHLGVPILDTDPDWSEGVRRGRSRQGSEFTSGRARGVSPLASRSRERHELRFVNGRDCGDAPAQSSFWRLVQFFDTRRGRLRSFWHVDHERIWTTVQLDPNFISVAPFGDFGDFEEELQGGQVGLVLRDGTFYVRDAVSVDDLGIVYKINVDPVLPSGLDVDDVVRVARARRVRFDSDEMEETWTNAGLAETTLRVIETLEEKDVPL